MFQIDPSTREWFTPSEQKDEVDPFALEIRPLTGREKLTMWSRSITDNTAQQIEAMYDVVCLAATNWRNAKKPDGQPAPFNGSASIETLPSEWVTEAYARIVELSTLTPEQAGNSR